MKMGNRRILLTLPLQGRVRRAFAAAICNSPPDGGRGNGLPAAADSQSRGLAGNRDQHLAVADQA
jgi:hypothetical protein